MTENTPTRPLGVAHLIFGLVFTGIAAIWLIGEANGTDIPDLAVAFPAVLIGAGIVGLVAITVNHRNAKAQLSSTPADDVPETTGTTETTETTETTDDTVTLSTEKDPT